MSLVGQFVPSELSGEPNGIDRENVARTLSQYAAVQPIKVVAAARVKQRSRPRNALFMALTRSH